MLNTEELEQLVESLILNEQLKEKLVEALIDEMYLEVSINEETDYYTSYQVVNISLTIGEYTITDSDSLK